MTEKQEQILNYIKSTFSEKGRPPRLKELSSKFEITNKAVLDHLVALEKDGFISMPDGVLSLRILKKYNNDIFISYIAEDKEIAERIYKYFADEGFNVWKDNLLKNGELYIKEIFENIKNSKTLILLLSNNSLHSKFVQKEVDCALAFQLEKGRPLVLPLKIDSSIKKEDIFPEIKDVHYEKYDAENPESSLIKLADRVQMLAYEYREPGLQNKKIKLNSSLEKFLNNANNDINASGKLGSGFKEIIISPVEYFSYPKNKLEELVKSSLVRINGWGGDRFPAYYGDYGKDPIYINDGLKSPSDVGMFDFLYWRIDENLNFASISSFRENDNEKIKNKISIEWLVFDIVRPLLFIKNLMELTGKVNWKIKFKWNGMKDRDLVVLSSNRFWPDQSYKCSENLIQRDFIINAETDLKQLAFDICYELLQLFQWKSPNSDMLTKDIDTLFDGRFM